MGLKPQFGALTLKEAAYLLQGVYNVDLYQFRNGVPFVSPAIHAGLLKYNIVDPEEDWQTAREIWNSGGGDCEDLAAAVAAEWTLLGRPSRPVIYRTGGPTAHVVVQDIRTRKLYDPSITGGMRSSRPWTWEAWPK